VVGNDDAVMGREVLGHAHEVVLVRAEAVQEHERLTLAALQVDVAQAVRQLRLLAREAGEAALALERAAHGVLGGEIEIQPDAEGGERRQAQQSQRNDPELERAHRAGRAGGANSSCRPAAGCAP